MKPTADRRPPVPPACPGREVLLGFDSGSLSDEDMEAVAFHLSTCDNCAAEYKGIVHGTPADALEEYLRAPPPAPVPAESGYAAMAAAARAIPGGQPDGDSTTDPPPDATPAPWPAAVGPYFVRRVLGSGGMGVVYEAVHSVLNRPVALKMIRDANLERADSLERFRTEAEAVARLRHPNVVEVVHFDEWNGLPYLVMELIDGRSLARTLLARGGTLPPREAAEVVRQVAVAVGYAHDRKVLHRDLKPGNVLVADDGTPKVTDFGLAKLLDDGRDGPTAADTVLGTPSYMAPEQARGDVAGVGPAADVYALGAILYECLAGRPPFRGGNKNQTLQLVLNTPPVPPSAVKPGVPPVLEAICLKCLAKEPDGRYASAAALADDLGRWLNAEKTAVRPAGWFGRHRRQVAAAFLVGLALGGGAVAAVTFDPDRPRREIAAKLDRGEAVELIGATGGPRWSEWVIGGDRGRVTTADDGTFLLDTWGNALVELAPDPRVTRYRYDAEIKHRNSDKPGSVGLYVARRGYAGGTADMQHLVECRFNDIRPAELPPKDGPRPPNYVHTGVCLKSDPSTPLPFDSGLGGVSGPTFTPANGREWRRLSLTVTPRGVQGTWDDEPFDLTAGMMADNQTAGLDTLRRLRPTDDPLRQLRPVFAPRGGLGIALTRGSASFRSVILTPLRADAD